MAISIVFNQINMNGQDTNSTVSVGEVLQSGWSSHSKQNAGQVSGTGINNTINFFSSIIDNDFVDAPIHDQDVTGSNQGQAL